ncbi:MAG: penicillin-insensitive murein endopeptidase [Gammaproteobacteria bacterium]|nr:penicillin-insensitive murein endopeptidase [Gammaproteobacteria bacterium]
MTARFIGFLFWLFLSSTLTHAGNGWSDVAYPLPGLPQVIGSYAAGCIAGAVPLPLLGDGYQVMRPSRNRYYGHPVLIAFVERLGRQVAASGRRLLIGDLGQPRGGPMPSGHRSHQIGLDVDIWFLELPRGRVLSPLDTEQLGAPSMIRAAEGVLDRTLWSLQDRTILKLASQAPEVERIFVNPIIKQALCASEMDHAWLTKIRPWWGHDDHLHIRLACPPDAGQCQPQKPLPSGDGCDADLARWVEEIRQAALSPKPYQKPKPPSTDNLPATCDAILHSPTAWKR